MPDPAEEIVVSRPSYRLTLPVDRPYAYLDTAGGRAAELFLLSTVDSSRGSDATTAMSGWERCDDAGDTVFTCIAGSAVWDRRTYQLRCCSDSLVYTLTVEGAGSLADVTYFGGYSAAHPRWGAGLFHSGHAFTRGFNPEPDAAGSPWFDARSESTIDLGGGPLPGRRHWFFTPAPFCYAFETTGEWLGIGLEAEPGGYRFTEFRYRGGDGFRFTVPYDGCTRNAGRYQLPSVRIAPSQDPLGALRQHCAHVRAAGTGPPDSSEILPTWWRQPIFCGWGAQCAQAAADQGYRRQHGIQAFIDTLRFAPAYARQPDYEAWLATLSAHDVHPGIVVIDDKWQRTYGNNEADYHKWPDLPGFSRRLHREDVYLLLWLKAWDTEGVPDEECITTEAGAPLAVDPTNPAYERRLRTAVRRMLARDGYDADGFKIDFTHRIPTGPGLRLHGDSWGLELMKRYLGIVHDEARQIKPYALVVAHAPHPYLADVVDMVRLNDMIDLTLAGPDHPGVLTALRRRAEVAHIARPDAPIDTDNWPLPDRRTWREYIRLQPELGVPALYFADAIDTTQEPLEGEDFDLIRETWKRYRQQLRVLSNGFR